MVWGSRHEQLKLAVATKSAPPRQACAPFEGTGQHVERKRAAGWACRRIWRPRSFGCSTCPRAECCPSARRTMTELDSAQKVSRIAGVVSRRRVVHFRVNLHHVEGFEPCTGERSSVRCLSCRQDNFWEMGATGSQKHIARNLQQPQP